MRIYHPFYLIAILFTAGLCLQLTVPPNMSQTPGRLYDIDCGNGEAWGVGTYGGVWKYEGEKWVQQKGLLRDISIGSDGDLWGIGRGSGVYHWENDKWQKVPGFAQQISVGNADNVWCVQLNGNIFKRENDKWTKINGKLKYISVGDDGTVWGVGPWGGTWLYNGTKFELQKGQVRKIECVNAREVYAISWGNHVLKWNGSDWDEMDQDIVDHIAVSGNGDMWTLGADAKIYKKK